MRTTSGMGPDRPAQDRLTDPDEIREARRILFATGPGTDPDWLSEAELFDGALELEVARDLEEWGEDPFGLW